MQVLGQPGRLADIDRHVVGDGQLDLQVGLSVFDIEFFDIQKRLSLFKFRPLRSEFDGFRIEFFPLDLEFLLSLGHLFRKFGLSCNQVQVVLMGCLRDGLDLGNRGAESGLGMVQAFLPGENGLEIELDLRDRFRRCIAAVSVRRNTWSIQIDLRISIARNLG
jgi:hypothetical protein